MKIFLSIFFLITVFSLSAQSSSFDSIRTAPFKIKLLSGVSIKSSNGIMYLNCKRDSAKKVLFIIDEKIIQSDKLKSTFENISPEMVDSIYTVSPVESTIKYGEKAKDGAVIFKMKKQKP